MSDAQTKSSRGNAAVKELPVRQPAKGPTVNDTKPKADTPERVDKSPKPTPSRFTIGFFVRRIVVLLVLIGIITAVSYLWSQAPTEETRLVLQGNIDVRQVNLSFKVDGRLRKLLVDEGDHVKKGQLIAKLDGLYFDDDLRVARAHRDSSKATLERLQHGSRPEEKTQAQAATAERVAALELCERNLKRAEALVKTKAMAQEDYDKAKSDYDSAVARLDQARQSQRLIDIGPRVEDIDAAKADLAMQEATVIQYDQRLKDSDLLAPNDGVILTRAQEEGAILPAGVTVLTLTLTSPVWVRTYVNERDLGLVRENMAADVYTDSDPGHPYAANVGFISPTAEFTPKTVETRQLRTDLVYNLRVIVENPDGGLRQGMPVSVALKLAKPRKLTFGERVHKVLERLHLAEGDEPK